MSRVGSFSEGTSRSALVSETRDAAKFDQIRAACEYFDNTEEALIQILHRSQEIFGYLREDVMSFVAGELQLPLSRVYGVATFYSFFSTVPQGRHTVMLCMGTACYVRGADKVLAALERELNIKAGETTHDAIFTLRIARCIGACGMAPAMVIDDDVHSQVKPDDIKKILKDYR